MRKYILLIVLGLACLILQDRIAFAKTDYCANSQNTILLLVDETTKYDTLDKHILREGLESLFSELNINDRLIMFPINNQASSGEKVFEQCYPGCQNVDEKSLLESFVQLFGVGEVCNRQQAKLDRISFTNELREKLRPILTQDAEYAKSSIIQTIAVKVRDYFSDKNFTKLIIFSDLIENSDEIPWPLIIETDDPKYLYERVKLDDSSVLNNVDIKIFGFGRFHNDERRSLYAREYRELNKFWQFFFNKEGARSLNISLYYHESS